ncbi:MAG: NAD(P)H-dependent oxidoreductase subunit E [Tenuifilum sp.]|uniref:NADH-quinone oxidoreductase subunit NuoE family protein n=1 Tax=Tenuifilum sp. TaxID=2760880 RepID=UPI001B4B5408|nr:NAD(P)H-dependent oxidoreductase subunit E [Bacteroidales bacterium]HOK62232.1 NAD(P)H-dependent oxidoreductase subunit E [Tenuifilum sp.]MBP9028671.1 NAD(P)H-dependent oxidoreductase subunit E [Bacteroidales bacterium]HOK86917.1 NAD(P)H-dependent oxidoreductase subunit E [Tenuifilum sp.]HON70038.1 NAD(P)H-dependent oxidoreductase subunit E [Tenuifilum sp.]
MEVEKILSKYPRRKDYLLEILHDIQNHSTKNFIPEEAVQRVAEHLNIKKAQVYGVIGYYSMLSIKPRGRYVIRVCASPICNMMGSCSLLDYLKQKLDVELGETSADGLFTLETSECLGNCAAAPAMMVNQEMYGNLSPGMIDSLLEHYSRQTK